MKNKKILYLLIPLVLVIWGIIIARIVSQIQKRNRIVEPVSESVEGKVQQPVPDTLVLKLTYRDPFLSRDNQVNETGNVNTAEVVRTNLVTQSNEINVPVIYSGLVTNPKSRKKTGLLKINQKNYLVREGQTVEGEKILKLSGDSVILVKGKIRRSVLKNKIH